jgi:hypothetical protein
MSKAARTLDRIKAEGGVSSDIFVQAMDVFNSLEWIAADQMTLVDSDTDWVRFIWEFPNTAVVEIEVSDRAAEVWGSHVNRAWGADYDDIKHKFSSLLEKERLR